MENHFHIIAKSEELSKNLRLMKSYSGRRIVDQLIKDGNTKLLAQLKFRKLRHKRHNNYQIWSEGLHPKQLTSDEMLEQKLEYIHYNPVACGFVDRPGHWRYSSARNYFGLDGLIPITLYEG
jgi:REP element-mobilizing transposase RayT